MQDSSIDRAHSFSPSRRQFLRAGTAAAFGLGLPSLGWLSGCASLPDSRALPWSELARAMQGPLLMPGSPEFAARARPWALQYAATLPQGIAQCAGETDVQACLRWAQANRVPLVARSGGHSYAGYSTTTGLMIDVSSMNRVDVDGATGIATLGGGARNKHVYAACRPYNRAVTHGRCRDVGVAGLVLGGGIGFRLVAAASGDGQHQGRGQHGVTEAVAKRTEGHGSGVLDGGHHDGFLEAGVMVCKHILCQRTPCCPARVPRAAFDPTFRYRNSKKCDRVSHLAQVCL